MLLVSALAVTYLGLACLALLQRPHFSAVSCRTAAAASPRTAPPPELGRRLLGRGCAGLLLGAALSFWSEGASFGGLSWVMLLAAAGMAVTFTLTWRPGWLRWLLLPELLPPPLSGLHGAGAAPRTAGSRRPRTR